MFCFQCEQTAGGHACTGCAGVCGKLADVANLQDDLTGALIGLARAIKLGAKPRAKTWKLLIDALFTTITNVNFYDRTVHEMMDAVQKEKSRIKGKKDDCACQDYDMRKIWEADEDIRSLKSLILFGMRGMAAYAYHAAVLGYSNDEIYHFLIDALYAIGMDSWGMNELLPIVLETGRINYICMELLDRANTETYGTPVPVTVPLKVEKGPFIIVSGHDLYDLKQLLEQTKNTNIHIYTHGEMLPAHAYPELKKYPNLKGHFGTAKISKENLVLFLRRYCLQRIV
jgi:hydroxylamine reductase